MPRSRSPKSSHYKNDYRKSGSSGGRRNRDYESSYYRDSSSSHRRRHIEDYEEEKKYRRRRSKSRSSSRQVYSSRHSYSRSRSRSGSYSRKSRNYHSRSNSASPSKSRNKNKHRLNRSHSRSRSSSRLSHSSRRHKNIRKTPDKRDSSKQHYSRSKSASRSPTKTDNENHRNKESHSSSSAIYKRNESQNFSNYENSYEISVEEQEARLHAINSIKEDFENTRFNKNTLSENLSYNIYENEDSQENDNSVSNNDEDRLEPFDKEKIHREIEEKLRLALAKEGKVYPPPKPEASHPVFANDGSFLEVFKRMQEQASNTINKTQQPMETIKKATILNPICKRRGGKILKTGIVAKPKTENLPAISDPKDVWSLYLQEVKKYKNTSCDVDGKTRPLMK